MKYLYAVLRVILALQLMVPVLALPYYCARCLGDLYAALHEEPYLKINPDVVDSSNEGRKVQLTAPVYTDEWLELRDIGVRCQALRLELRDSAYTQELSYRGLPLRSRCCFARNVRMGAFSLQVKDEYMAGRMGTQAIPWDLLNLPEAWKPHCRTVQDEFYEESCYLNLEFEGEPVRRMHCSMAANGSVVTVRGVQCGSEIRPVHGLYHDEHFFAAMDAAWREREWYDACVGLLLPLMVPALLLGIFRLVYWQKGGNSAPLAIWLMMLLVSAAFLCFSGVGDIVWLGAAAVLAFVSLWQIGRIVRTFGVDGKCC